MSSDCHSTGVKLILPKDVTGYTLKANWLQADMKIIELEIDGERIDEFEMNVFVSPVFGTVKKMTLKNVQHLMFYQYDIRNYVFNGLDALEDLIITNAALKIYDNGMLDYMNETLKSFVLTGMGQEQTMNIDKFVGGDARILPHVEYVKIQYKLLDSINYRSFTAIPNVKVLDLSNCNISVIGQFSFEKLDSQLQLLNLEGNSLKTLPSDIFSDLHLSSTLPESTLQSAEELDTSKLIIRLNDNPWHCDCSLEHLKELLNANTNFDGHIVCTTPEEIKDYHIKETEFCPLPITTDATTATAATTEIVTTPIDKENNNEKGCYSYSNVEGTTKIAIVPKMQAIRLDITAEGASIKLEKTSSNLILIWFKSETFTNDTLEYHQNTNVSDCFTDLSNPIHITNLDNNTTYTFCLMNITQQTVSPFDCLSYHHQRDVEQFTWLYENSKSVTICIAVFSCIASIIIGMIMGAIFMKCKKDDSFSFRLALQCWKNDPESSNFINDYK